MAINVMKYKRRIDITDINSKELYYLKPVPGRHRIYDLRKVAKRIEKTGSLSNEDVYHVLQSFVREMKEVLVEGDKVKVEGFGIFHLSINCEGVEKEEDCTVRNIKKVNICFRTDPTLRLVNDTTSTTRGGDNNVEFVLVNKPSGSSSGGGGKDDGDGDWEDPNA